ncbi:hypothetical protein BJV78DRAFT_1156837 [Lactifluus subvellereus]|nr:hypothetical protein BJV78DRAFT_1156837 [Lactifluus subvellereus]
MTAWGCAARVVRAGCGAESDTGRATHTCLGHEDDDGEVRAGGKDPACSGKHLVNDNLRLCSACGEGRVGRGERHGQGHTLGAMTRKARFGHVARTRRAPARTSSMMRTAWGCVAREVRARHVDDGLELYGARGEGEVYEHGERLSGCDSDGGVTKRRTGTTLKDA